MHIPPNELETALPLLLRFALLSHALRVEKKSGGEP